MNRLLTTLLLATFSMTAPPALAIAASTSDCEARALTKDGKPMTGAAKTTFMKKCTGEAPAALASKGDCASRALSKSGNPLYGAAKKAFIRKCEKDTLARAGK